MLDHSTYFRSRTEFLFLSSNMIWENSERSQEVLVLLSHAAVLGHLENLPLASLELRLFSQQEDKMYHGFENDSDSA